MYAPVGESSQAHILQLTGAAGGADGKSIHTPSADQLLS